jgi:ABC-2 type transport system ATP-binding protein
MTEPVARLAHVRKCFGGREAVADLSLDLYPGELLALLGPNGAGKSTAISLLLGRRAPDGGVAQVFGQDPRRREARTRVGVTFQENAFPSTLRVAELVRFVSAHYEHPVDTDELLERFRLSDAKGRQAGGLSGGMQRRLGVALAFAGNPSLVVLDEPTTGLDVQSQLTLWRAIRTFVAAGGSVLLTTHYLREAEELASRVVVLQAGRAIASGTVPEIRAQVTATRVSFRAERLPEFGPGQRVVAVGDRWCVYTSEPESVVRALVSGGEFDGLEVAPATLEEAFLALTGGG